MVDQRREMTIQLSPEQEQVVERAIRSGLIKTADEVVDAGVETIRQRLEPRAAALPLNDDEWMAKFRALARSQPTGPLLSDEAIDRESIYRERGL